MTEQGGRELDHVVAAGSSCLPHVPAGMCLSCRLRCSADTHIH